jgi:hypothetical protein
MVLNKNGIIKFLKDDQDVTGLANKINDIYVPELMLLRIFTITTATRKNLSTAELLATSEEVQFSLKSI